MSVEEAHLVVARDGLGIQKQYWIWEAGFWDGLHQEGRRTCNRDGSSNRCGVNITVRSDNQSWSGSHREHIPRGKFNSHVCVMSPSISHEFSRSSRGDPSINNRLCNGSRQPASWSVSLAAHPVQRVLFSESERLLEVIVPALWFCNNLGISVPFTCSWQLTQVLSHYFHVWLGWLFNRKGIYCLSRAEMPSYNSPPIVLKDSTIQCRSHDVKLWYYISIGRRRFSNKLITLVALDFIGVKS
jgi:hypothetical protein